MMQRRPAVDQFELDGTGCNALDEDRVETRLLELRGKGAADARIPPAVRQRRFRHDRAAGRSGHETDQQARGKAEDVVGTEGVHPGRLMGQQCPGADPPPSNILAVKAIIRGAKTGQTGDGKIFILDLKECVRIRTEEHGSEAIG